MSKQKESPVAFARSLGILFILVFAFKQSVLDANNIPSGSMIPTLKIGDYLFVNKMRYSLRIPFLNTEILRIDDPERGDIVTFIPPGDPGKHYVKRVVGTPGDRLRITNVSVCDPSLPVERSEQSEYSCNQIREFGLQEPVIAFLEYKENDEGPWKHYALAELNPEEGRRELINADNVGVLHPDLLPENRLKRRLPVVFTEKTGSHRHMIVETQNATHVETLCGEIDTAGCVLPEDEYFLMGDNRDDSKDSRYWQVGPIHRRDIYGKALIIYFSINWRDSICQEYSEQFASMNDPSAGFPLEDFPPEEQLEHCSPMDSVSASESVFQYMIRTVLYRIPRMSVRWDRPGTLLE